MHMVPIALAHAACFMLSAPALAGPPIVVAVDEGNNQCGPASAARGVWSLFGASSGFADANALMAHLTGEMGTSSTGTTFIGFVHGKLAINLKLLAGAAPGEVRTGLTTTGYSAYGGTVMDMPGFDDLLDPIDRSTALANLRAAIVDPNVVIELIVTEKTVSGWGDAHCLNVTGLRDLPGGGFGFTGIEDPVQGDGVAANHTVTSGTGQNQTVTGPFDHKTWGPLPAPNGTTLGYHIMYVIIEKKEPYKDGKPVSQITKAAEPGKKTHASDAGERQAPSHRW